MPLRRTLLRALVRYYVRPKITTGSPDVSIEARRRAMERIQALTPGRGSFSETRIGGVPAAWVRAEGAGEDRAILYLHGGGYCFGSPRSYRSLAAALSQAAEAPVLLPDYRLAPEHPHPAAVEDAFAVYRALVKETDPQRLVVAGDSAGGGLTLALALRLKETGAPLPAGLVLLSPWTDLTMSGGSVRGKAGADPMLEPDSLALMAGHYLAGADPRQPTASPLFGDLSGLPPMLIHVARDEVLLDDARRLADKVRAAGGEAILHIEPRLWHVWHSFTGLLPEANRSIAEIAGTCRRWWGRG